MEQERGMHMQASEGRTRLSTRVPWRHIHYSQHLAHSFLWLKFTLLIKFHLLDASVYLAPVIFAKYHLPPTLSLIATEVKMLFLRLGRDPCYHHCSLPLQGGKYGLVFFFLPLMASFPLASIPISLHFWCFILYFRQIDLLFRRSPNQTLFICSFFHNLLGSSRN